MNTKIFNIENDSVSSVYDSLVYTYQLNKKPIHFNFRNNVLNISNGDRFTHFLHPYPAKLLPHIAYFFLKAFQLENKEKIVLDPFCGSGTVGLEASLLGYQSLIADINPFARLLAVVKTCYYDENILYDLLNYIVEEYKKCEHSAHSVEVMNKDYWYSENTSNYLNKLIAVINKIESEDYKNFYLVCFSLLARKLSYMDLAITVPVKLRTKEIFSYYKNEKINNHFNEMKILTVDNFLDFFKKIVKKSIERVIRTNKININREKSIVVSDNVLNILSPSENNSGVKENSIPLIITSPPYGSAQKYIRSSSITLNWLQLTKPKELNFIEKDLIGTEKISLIKKKYDFNVEDLPSEFGDLIEEIKFINPNRAKITLNYFLDLKKSIEKMVVSLKIGGYAVIVIGNNYVCKKYIRNDIFIIECFKELGVALEVVLIDTIKTRGLMVKRNSTAAVITEEYILVFKK